MNKILKYSIVVAIIGVSIYNSIYIESITERNKEKQSTTFNAKVFAENFITNQVRTFPAIQASDFLTGISSDLKTYCQKKGKVLGISNYYNFIIEGNATVTAINEEYVLVTLINDKTQKIKIATDFIFGNSIRDASHVADIGEFQNTMDFNNISIELNNIVREKVIPSFKDKIKEGSQLYFKGAIKINLKSPDFESFKMIPLIIKPNN